MTGDQILGLIMLFGMITVIFVGFPISFTLLFLGLVFGAIGLGAELTFNTVNLTGPLTWNSQLNLAWNRNRVLELGSGDRIESPAGVGAGAVQNPTVLQVGQPTNAFLGFVYAGKDASGAIQYKDINGDGVVNSDDRAILGNAQPNYIGGFNNDFG